MGEKPKKRTPVFCVQSFYLIGEMFVFLSVMPLLKVHALPGVYCALKTRVNALKAFQKKNVSDFQGSPCQCPAKTGRTCCLSQASLFSSFCTQVVGVNIGTNLCVPAFLAHIQRIMQVSAMTNTVSPSNHLLVKVCPIYILSHVLRIVFHSYINYLNGGGF